MVSLSLDQQLAGHTYAFMLVFTRVAAVFMLFPGIGETFVPARVRMLFSLLFTLIIYTPLLPLIPQTPGTPSDLALALFREILVGLFFGTLLRLLLGILETAGAIVAAQLGLSSAMIFNPAQASQSYLTSAFLSVTGLALVFVTGLDHMLIRAVVGTYDLFPPAQFVEPGDMVETFSHLVMKAFAVGVELAAPLLFAGLLLYVILGFMQRLMPQIQLFLVTIPLQIWGGLLIFCATLTLLFTVWLQVFSDTVSTLMAG